jgi:UDP-N-acetylglucosamine--N-acetylmuramyl-(pentapeptide) pyrophosphoryl-undecaprenol N-acetylglucosamine transferase
MRVVFCGGGTGGHVYPALTVAAALKRVVDGPLELLYIGVRGKIDRELVTREGIPFASVTAGPLRTPTPFGTVAGGFKLLAGIAQSYRLLRRFCPDVVFATGGYGSVGVGLAARLRKLPLLLFEPGPEAGLAVRLLAKYADRIAVTIPPALALMPAARTTMPGYPVRPSFFDRDRAAARARFGLDPSLPVLLVSGASSGSTMLNDAAIELAPSYLRKGQLLHLTGANDDARVQSVRATFPETQAFRWHSRAYLHGDEMADALAAADLAIMRAGASTLGELPAARLPAILVPGEYEGWAQTPNAAYMEQEGAAVLLPQSRLRELPSLVDALLSDPPRLEAMRDKLAALSRPNAAEDLVNLVIEMARAGTNDTKPSPSGERGLGEGASDRPTTEVSP